MEPIVSPWLIYSLSIVGSLWELCSFISVTCLLLAFVMRIEMNDIYDENDLSKCRRWLKLLIVVAAVFALLSFFLPTKETYMAMIAASYVTTDNIQAVQGNIIDFIAKLTEAASQHMK